MEDAIKKWFALPKVDRDFVVNGLKNVMVNMYAIRAEKARAAGIALDLLILAGAPHGRTD